MRVAVLKGTRQLVGRVGFHQPPDAEGVVEIGYTVTPRFRRPGSEWVHRLELGTPNARSPSLRRGE